MAEPRGATSSEEGAWEVLAQPTADPAELVPYSPGPQDGPDPVTVVMTESRIRIQTFESGWTLAGAAVWAVGWLGLSPWLLFGAGGLPDPPSWILMTFASTGIAGVLLWAVGAIRRRAPRRSVIRLTNEGLSVTTSTGAIHRVTRQDIAVLRLFRSSEGDKNQQSSLHLRCSRSLPSCSESCSRSRQRSVLS